MFTTAIFDLRFKLVTQTYWFNQIVSNEKGDEFVETLKRDIELLYSQYVAFSSRGTSDSKLSSFDTRSESSFSMGSSS